MDGTLKKCVICWCFTFLSTILKYFELLAPYLSKIITIVYKVKKDGTKKDEQFYILHGYNVKRVRRNTIFSLHVYL